MLMSTNQRLSEAVRLYGYRPNQNGGFRVVREQSELLLQAIPHLIEALEGDLKPKAYQILISIQASCPPAEQFGRWWITEGKNEFMRARGLKE